MSDPKRPQIRTDDSTWINVESRLDALLLERQRALETEVDPAKAADLRGQIKTIRLVKAFPSMS